MASMINESRRYTVGTMRKVLNRWKDRERPGVELDNTDTVTTWNNNTIDFNKKKLKVAPLMNEIFDCNP